MADMVTALFVVVLLSVIALQVAALSDDSEARRLSATDHSASLFNLIDADVLEGQLRRNADYQRRSPFPYAVVDDLFPSDILQAINEEIPEDPALENGCVKGSDKCSVSSQNEVRHNALGSDGAMGPATLALFTFLKSSQFIKFLEKLTGVDTLLPDPQSHGSGVFQTLFGGFQKIHADANKYPRYDLHRRVNVVLFLNPEWKDEYGGHLELWSRDLRRCGAKIRPSFGRLVIFSSSDYSFHGHPSALQTPPGRSRRSLEVSYYTSSRPSSECMWWSCNTLHPTLWQAPSCSSCDERYCRAYDKIL